MPDTPPFISSEDLENILAQNTPEDAAKIIRACHGIPEPVPTWHESLFPFLGGLIWPATIAFILWILHS